jgi:hypothetical protein
MFVENASPARRNLYLILAAARLVARTHLLVVIFGILVGIPVLAAKSRTTLVTGTAS